MSGSKLSLKIIFSLLHFQFGPLVMNCLNSEKQRQARSAIIFAPFVKFVAESYGKKTEKDTEHLIRTLAKLTGTEFVQILILRRVEYVKFKNGVMPSNNALRDRLKKLLDDKQKV